MAVGNVVGSNIFNALLIVGCAAMVAPMHISVSTVRKDLPFAVLAALLMLVLWVSSSWIKSISTMAEYIQAHRTK